MSKTKRNQAQYSRDQQSQDRRAPQDQHDAGDVDTATPEDRERVAERLLRKLMDVVGHPRRCREPVCRRLRRCAGPDIRCQRDFPPPPCSEEELQETRANLRQAIDARLAQLSR